MTYFLFTGVHYYPSGGAGDFVDSFDDIRDAKRRGDEALDEQDDWAEIARWDGATLNVVAGKERGDADWRERTPTGA